MLPSDAASGQQGARLAFQAAIRAEGKPSGRGSAVPIFQRPQTDTFAMPAQLGKVAGVEHGEPVPAAPHVRRLARELGVDIHTVKGTGSERAHQRKTT